MTFKIQENNIVRDATPEEIAIFEADQLERGKTSYIKKREAAYPSIIDYIDGVVKGDQAQVQAYIDACLAVKAKYPKP
jgi:hypothetical protein